MKYISIKNDKCNRLKLPVSVMIFNVVYTVQQVNVKILEKYKEIY